MKEKDPASPILDETLPHQAHFPSFKGTGIEMQPPFVNDYGVVIGDSLYSSENSPLNHWSDEVPPEIMAGDQWVHPTNDIGWTSGENQELLEEKRGEREREDGHEADIFMHPHFGIND
ncbi:DUF3905 domain-containing protein [Ectobacillus ponti]|uniref:DUF3905 domain-containing protein n=1 Tax=Ectobacillus ponti TaxID=2961894 RepID=A0AA42BQJ5_9BACI|nr:DUF3905 domain-containing protein [Ectobacillus ponti]MCP8968514.1 DUF3905 domain-containing protein [Ectobacillus ponti]